jgi:hypothetical protein
MDRKKEQLSGLLNFDDSVKRLWAIRRYHIRTYSHVEIYICGLLYNNFLNIFCIRLIIRKYNSGILLTEKYYYQSHFSNFRGVEVC